jgi:Flp pilus assembly protein TadG
MRLILGRINPKRPRERGVAAIEFALILPFVAMIVLALIDYGYYFYIGINAAEAARAAAVQASTTAAAMNSGAGPTGCGDANIGQVTCCTPTPPSPLPADVQAAKDYMTNQVNGTIGGNTSATIGCSTVGATPAKTMFSIQVTVTFAPPSGTVHFGLPRSGNNLVYKTQTLWRWFD